MLFSDTILADYIIAGAGGGVLKIINKKHLRGIIEIANECVRVCTFVFIVRESSHDGILV